MIAKTITHETAQDWYESYAWACCEHRHHGLLPWDDIDTTDEHECPEVIEMSRWVRDAACDVEAALEAVVAAIGDDKRVSELLDEAQATEYRLGQDWPATKALRAKIDLL